MRRPLLQAWLGLAALWLAAISGCSHAGPELASVQGDVRWNGEPLPDVLVEFQPEYAGSPSVGITDEEGHFQLQFTKDRSGALLGRHTVRINYDTDGREGHFGNPIPARYHIQSQLKRDVKPGHNIYQFDLQSDDRVTTSLR